VIEIQSQGIPELPIESAADIALIQGGGTPSSKGFLVLANQTLNYWRQLTTAQKRAHLVEFRAIRQIVINRTGTATQMTQAGKTTLANQWNAADAGL
jgi:Cu2+-containing amine oxidase